MIRRHTRSRDAKRRGGHELRTPLGSVGQRQPRRRSRGAPPRPSWLRIHWRLVMASVLLAGAVAGGIWTWQSPLLRVQRVEVTGAAGVSERAILDRVDFWGESLLTADLETTAAAIAELPSIASASLARRWPDTVRITVRERQPWGSWEQAGLRYTIDHEGVVLGHASPPAGSPVIVSSAAFSLRAGDRVDGEAVAVAMQIAGQIQQTLGMRAVEVAYTPGEGVRVRTADGHTALLGDSSGISYKLAVWAHVAQEATARGISYSVIDLRYGDRPVLRREPSARGTP